MPGQSYAAEITSNAAMLAYCAANNIAPGIWDVVDGDWIESNLQPVLIRDRTISQIYAPAGALVRLADSSGNVTSYDFQSVGGTVTAVAALSDKADYKNLEQLHASLSGAAYGSNDVDILCQGDSISRGFNLTSVNQHYSYQLAKLIAKKYGLEFGEGWIWLSNAGNPQYLSTLVVGAGWNLTYGNPVYQQTARMAASTVPTSIDITFAESVDSVDILVYESGPGNTNGFRYSWNGGAITEVPRRTTSQWKWFVVNVPAPSRGTHTLNLWAPTSGNANIGAVCPRDSTMRKVRHATSGVSGKCAADISAYYVAKNVSAAGTVADAVAAMGIDLFVLEIGTNDQTQQINSSNGETWKGFVSNIFSRLRERYNPTCVLVSPTPTSQSGSYIPTTSDFVEYGKSVCEKNGATFVDMASRWSDYLRSVSVGFMHPDGIHPAATGGADYACGIAKELALP